MGKFFLGVALLFLSGAAEAISGNKLIEYRQATDAFNRGLYYGYISGASDVGSGYMFCLPSGVTNGQTVAVVEKYMDAHPESWTDSADVLVIRALAEAFPCQKSKSG